MGLLTDCADCVRLESIRVSGEYVYSDGRCREHSWRRTTCITSADRQIPAAWSRYGVRVSVPR